MLDPSAPIYPVADQLWSTHDLLAKFIDPAHQLNGLSRFSDLHLKVGQPVTYRYDGDLAPVPDAAPLTPALCEQLVFPLLTPKQIEFLKAEPPTDIDASWEWLEHKINFRFNVFHDREGLSAVLRVLPPSIPDVDQIGFPNDRIWQEICALSQGLVLVTGQTGTGKSTTIAAMLKQINRTRRVRIITLEDPIEYIFTSNRALFSQREVNRHVTSFAAGLRSALREDPDIIYVGEMRDSETAALALTAAETGHLVFSTLHTRDTRSAITRIIDMFPSERTKEVTTQLSLSLHSVLGGKLLSRVSGGRIMAMEVLKNTLPMANLIRTGAIHQIQSLLETGMKEGMNTLDHHIQTLLQEGEITHEEALLAATDPKAFPPLAQRPRPRVVA
ncbi:MAG: PilT/PilU family type 4a pilus ATPase [Verrucomicrobia bacterium]|nr:PilT/PilU family type 4a pilus ATPase [Verrucomicrobiota bacterium]